MFTKQKYPRPVPTFDTRQKKLFFIGKETIILFTATHSPTPKSVLLSRNSALSELHFCMNDKVTFIYLKYPSLPPYPMNHRIGHRRAHGSLYDELCKILEQQHHYKLASGYHPCKGYKHKRQCVKQIAHH